MHHDRRRAPGDGTDLWRVILPPAIWAGHFLICYVAMAIACEKAGFALGRAWVLGTTGGALGALAAVTHGLWRVRARSQTENDYEFEHNTPEERHRFLSHVALMLCALSAVGVVYVALPVVVMGGCQ
jgi:hypothetical protein